VTCIVFVPPLLLICTICVIATPVPATTDAFVMDAALVIDVTAALAVPSAVSVIAVLFASNVSSDPGHEPVHV
jgi:hypothetical protein